VKQENDKSKRKSHITNQRIDQISTNYNMQKKQKIDNRWIEQISNLISE